MPTETIEEVRKKKEVLSENIMNLLQQFQNETGVNVKDISCSRIATDIKCGKVYFLSDVQIDLDI